MLEGINEINWEHIGYGESLYPENIPNICSSTYLK